MAKGNRGQTKTAPAAEVQQAQSVPEWLRPYVAEFRLMGRLWAGDTTVTEQQVRSAFAEKLASDNGKHKGPIDGAVNQLVVLHGKPMSAFNLALGDGNTRKVKIAEQAIDCAKEAGYPMRGWNKPAALQILAAWEKKHEETTSEPSNIDETNLLALLSLPTGPPAQVRFPEFYEWAHSESYSADPNKPQRQTVDDRVIDNAMEDARLESAIAELEARMAIVSDPKNPAKNYEEAGVLDAKINDLRAQRAALKGKERESKPKAAAKTTTIQEQDTTLEAHIADLEAQIADLEAQESEAVTAKEYTKAGEISAEIGNLAAEIHDLSRTEKVRKQIAAEQVAPETAAKTPATPKVTAPTPSKGNGTLTLAQAILVCKAPDATKPQKKVFARYNSDENFGDTEFVATVQALQ